MEQTRGSPRNHAARVRIRTTRDSDRGRLHDAALDAVALEPTVQPETVEPGLLDRHDLNQPAEALLGLGLEPVQESQERLGVAALDLVLGHLLAVRRQRDDEPGAAAQFQ
jgi:hypothetical protein